MTTTTESKTINFDNGYGIYFDADDIETVSPELEEEINRMWDVIVWSNCNYVAGNTQPGEWPRAGTRHKKSPMSGEDS